MRLTGCRASFRRRNALPHLPRFKSSSSAREFKVVLDNETLYVDKVLAEALGWSLEMGSEGVKLSLHGWAPKYFVITPSGSAAEQLARATVESGQDVKVQSVLERLKDYDASRDECHFVDD